MKRIHLCLENALLSADFSIPKKIYLELNQSIDTELLYSYGAIVYGSLINSFK